MGSIQGEKLGANDGKEFENSMVGKCLNGILVFLLDHGCQLHPIAMMIVV